MNIDINTPEISALLQMVEQKSQISPRLVSDFQLLADKIRREGERLSQSTLERVWQYSTRRNNTVAEHTLNVLARYVDFPDWEAFQRSVRSNKHPESNYFTDGILDVDTLPEGSMLTLTWLPDRKITVRYLGSRRFEVVESLNSGIRPADTFECSQIQIGQPLYLDHYRRATDHTSASATSSPNSSARYVVGRDTGLLSAHLTES